MAEHEMSISQASLGRHHVQSLSRGLRLITCFGDGRAHLTLEEASRAANISRSATRRLLRTLIEAGYVAYDGTSFSLTPRVLDLGYGHQSRLTLAEIARPHTEALSRQLRRTVSVGVLDGQDVVFVQRSTDDGPLSVSLTVGSRVPAHRTALGCVLLAWLPEAELSAYLASMPSSGTGRWVRTEGDVRRLLARAQTDGWIEIADELEEGLMAVAAPIRDRSGRVVAAVNVAAPMTGTAGDGQDARRYSADLLPTAARIGMDVRPAHLG